MDLDPPRLRLLELIAEHDTNPAEVSRTVLGRNHAYLHQYLKQGTPRALPEDVRDLLARHWAVPADDFKPGGRAKPPPIIENANVVEIRGEEYALIDVYDLGASAGYGAINDEEDGRPLHQHLFRLNWLRDITKADPSTLAVIRVSGDSMWETLHNGDHVLVDRTVRVVGRDGIYVFRIAGSDELLIKRLIRRARTKTLTIKADNPIYPVEDGVLDDDLEIAGRVIWLGRNVGG